MIKKVEIFIHNFFYKNQNKISLIAILIFSLSLSSCFLGKGKILVSLNRNSNKSIFSPTVTNIAIVDNQLIITGTNLSNVTMARVKDSASFEESFSIESASNTQLIANGKKAVSFLIGSTLDLILSNADASATFAVTFSLTDKSVAITKLSGTGVSIGQYLKFNGTNWVGASLPNSQTYLGTWNATTHLPDITTLGGFNIGDYYIINVAGTYTNSVLTTSPTTFALGDWVLFNGTSWDKIAASNAVSSFNTRTGAITPQAGDYTWSMITKTGSKLQDIADINVTGIADGQVLKWNATTSKWDVSNDNSGVAAGSIVDADISGTAAIAQSKISGLTTALSGKEPSITAGTTAQYLRGNKTLSTFATDVINSVLSGYVKGSNTAVAATDSVLQAMQKLEGQVSAVSSDYVSKTGTSQTISGTFSFTSPISFLYTNTPTGTTATEVTNVSYVTSAIAANGIWNKSGANINYMAGNVGIGTTTPSTQLTVSGTSTLNGNLAVNGTMTNTVLTNSNALASVTADYTSTNIIRSTAAAANCGTLNITNVANGSYTLTLLNATTTCTTIQLNGSTTNVKLPANYAGGASVSGIVYTFIYDGLTLWVSAVPF